MSSHKTILIFLCLLGFPPGLYSQQQNLTSSPDGRKQAWTQDGNIFVKTGDGAAVKITSDGDGGIINNGYASWIYYEEIFGRQSRYCAFWWSPDSKRLAFFRFDDTLVPEYVIEDGGTSVSTRYPRPGDPNPEVSVGIYELKSGKIIWAAFPKGEDVYYGTPYWDKEGSTLYVQQMPRLQNELHLFSVDAANGKAKKIYSESYRTWETWIEDPVMGNAGMYVIRNFETGWEQLYFLPYNGGTPKALTDGRNWKMKVIAADEKKGTVYFTSQRDSDLRECFYSVDFNGKISTLTHPGYNVRDIRFVGKGYDEFEATLSNMRSPERVFRFETGNVNPVALLEDRTPEGFDPSNEPVPSAVVYMTLPGDCDVPAMITYPKGFDRTKKYPVVMEVYGGPQTQYVRDIWKAPSEKNRWFWENGYIRIVADGRASGHCGRRGTDMAYKDMVSLSTMDFVHWANYIGSLPYVDRDRIGIEGFSFGGSVVAMLLIQRPGIFRCAVAGGGVYDWTLYDSNYTERFLQTPELNPDGYRRSNAILFADMYDPQKGTLKLTHGLSDDNVHAENTIKLSRALEELGHPVQTVLFPGEKHGYKGESRKADELADREFWNNYLK